MKIGYSINKLKAMIESGSSQGGNAYCLDKVHHDEFLPGKNTLYQFNYSKCISYKGTLYMFGGHSISDTYCILENGSWISAGKMPFYFSGGGICEFEGKIHFVGSSKGGYENIHYTFDGTTWTKLNNFPTTTYYNSLVILNDTLYCLAGYNMTAMYKYHSNSDVWEQISNNYSVNANKGVCVYNNKIYVFDNYLYIYDGTTWTNSSPTTTQVNGKASTACTYNGEIFVLSHDNTGGALYLYDAELGKWTEIHKFDSSSMYGHMCIHDNKLYIFHGNNTYTTYTYVYGDFIEGSVKAGTSIYVPGKSLDINNNLEVVEDGYIATENTDVSIMIVK